MDTISELIKNKTISASKLKVYEACSWLYWANYELYLPKTLNEGASKGLVCHAIFELLSHPRHQRYFDKIIESGSIKGNYRENGVVLELIWKLMKKNKLPDKDEVYNQIQDMIMVGLTNEWKTEGLIGVEHEFKINNESPKYFIYGFIDRINIINDTVFIYDYKSSKNKFTNEELKNNLQGLMYILAAKKLWPNKKYIVKFIFLQYPRSPIQTLEFSDSALKGFEYFLESRQQEINNFTKNDAIKNFAARQEYPTDGSFGGPLMCGKAKKPNELKSDGFTLKWSCPHKFPYFYYVLLKDNKILQSSLIREELKLKEGEIIEKRKYEGCAAFNNIGKDKFI